MTTTLSDTRSRDWHARALRVLPGGVNSPVRAMKAIGRDPIWIERGEGAEIVDVDGNRYVDYVCSWGPLIHGHAHPRILAAIEQAARRGTTFGAPAEGELTLAEEIAGRMPSVEMVRMTSSGTEASMTAIRLARAATGRERIVKFAGAYHGHVDSLLAEAGSGVATGAGAAAAARDAAARPGAGAAAAARDAAARDAAARDAGARPADAGSGGPLSTPSSPGVTAATAADTIVVPWNDREALSEAVQRHRPAAILAEPLPANMGLVPPIEGFLEHARALADSSGALLVLDEVISGFRVCRGGAQELLDVTGDLTIMGKVIGGGLPAGAVGGSRELMGLLAPSGEVYQAGTLSGNPLAVAAGLEALRMLDEEAYRRLAAITERLAGALTQAAAGHPVQVASMPGLLTVFFSERPVQSFADAAACDLDSHAAWCRALLARGVYPPPSQFEAWFPSLAHTDEQIDRTAAAAAAAFEELR